MRTLTCVRGRLVILVALQIGWGFYCARVCARLRTVDDTDDYNKRHRIEAV